MKNILLGFLCLFADVTIVVCLQHFGFVLLVVGIIFLCFAFLELETENENFAKAIYYALAMACIRVFLFALQCFNSELVKGSTGAVVALLPCLFLCYMLNHVLFCFSDISYEQRVLLPLTQSFIVANLCCLLNAVAIFLALFSVLMPLNYILSVLGNILTFVCLCIIAKKIVRFSKNIACELNLSN